MEVDNMAMMIRTFNKWVSYKVRSAKIKQHNTKAILN